jgi:hypothetical protein
VEKSKINFSLEFERGGNWQIDNNNKKTPTTFLKYAQSKENLETRRKKCVVLVVFYKLVNLKQPQVMRCLLCYNAHVNVSNPRMQARKGLISYYKTNNITSLKKHVDANQYLIFKKIE